MPASFVRLKSYSLIRTRSLERKKRCRMKLPAKIRWPLGSVTLKEWSQVTSHTTTDWICINSKGRGRRSCGYSNLIIIIIPAAKISDSTKRGRKTDKRLLQTPFTAHVSVNAGRTVIIIFSHVSFQGKGNSLKSCFRFTACGPLLDPQITWNGNSSKNCNYSHNDHQFNQGEPFMVMHTAHHHPSPERKYFGSLILKILLNTCNRDNKKAPSCP